MAEDPKLIELVDDLHAPEIFAMDATGFLNLNGCIAITLECGKSDYSTDPAIIRRVVVGRLIMNVPGAQAMAVGLFDFLKSQGFMPEVEQGAVQ